MININTLRETIKKIENFHFLFTAISSQRASGLESLYSKHSRNLRDLKNKTEINKNLSELFAKLKSKIPDLEIYKINFQNLRFTNKITRDKKLIQYIFSGIENNLIKTSELKTFNITLEHIESQKNKGIWASEMGNLIPLDSKINSEIGNIEFKKKVVAFNKSELKIVKEFCKKYKNQATWTKVEVDKRTTDLAERTFKLWKL